MNDSQEPHSYEDIWKILCEVQQRLSKLEQALERIAPSARVPVPPSPPPPPPPSPPVVNIPEAPPQPPILLQSEPASSAQPAPILEGGASELLAGLDSAAAAQRKAKPRPTLEQMIGTKWLLIVGVVVLLAAGVFFYQYALREGWINPAVRVLMGAVWALLVLAAAEWSLRKKMRYFAAGLFALGIVWLYHTVYVASPNGTYQLIDAAPAFALMCLVTLIGAGLSLRSRLQLAAIISLLGAFAAPILLSTGQNEQIFLMSYMLLVTAGFLTLGMVRRWRVLGPLAVACTAILFALWCDKHYAPDAFARTLAFGWALGAILSGYSVVGILFKRVEASLGGFVLLSAVAGLGVLIGQTADGLEYLHPFAIQMLVLPAGVLGFAIWRKWTPLPLIAMVVAILVVMFHLGACSRWFSRRS